MVVEESFLQMNYKASQIFIENTKHLYITEAEKILAANCFIQGRVSAVSQLDALVERYNALITEHNALKEKTATTATVSTEDLGL